MRDEATCICNDCGEAIVVPVDPLRAKVRDGSKTDRSVAEPIVIHVEIDEDCEVWAWAKGEYRHG